MSRDPRMSGLSAREVKRLFEGAAPGVTEPTFERLEVFDRERAAGATVAQAIERAYQAVPSDDADAMPSDDAEDPPAPRPPSNALRASSYAELDPIDAAAVSMGLMSIEDCPRAPRARRERPARSRAGQDLIDRAAEAFLGPARSNER